MNFDERLDKANAESKEIILMEFPLVEDLLDADSVKRIRAVIESIESITDRGRLCLLLVDLIHAIQYLKLFKAGAKTIEQIQKTDFYKKSVAEKLILQNSKSLHDELS